MLTLANYLKLRLDPMEPFAPKDLRLPKIIKIDIICIIGHWFLRFLVLWCFRDWVVPLASFGGLWCFRTAPASLGSIGWQWFPWFHRLAVVPLVPSAGSGSPLVPSWFPSVPLVPLGSIECQEKLTTCRTAAQCQEKLTKSYWLYRV